MEQVWKSDYTTFSIVDKLIWFMIYTWLIVDSITGFFISYGIAMPLSQIFKLLVLLLVIFRLCKNRMAFTISYFLMLYIAFYFLHLALIVSDFKAPVILLSKFLSLFFLYLYFRFCIVHFPAKTISNAYKAMIIAWIVVAFNVIMGLLGFGIPSYGDEGEGMGVKGFFYAGNELAGIMAVLIPFIVYLIILRFSGFKSFISYVIILILGIVIGTKSSILVTLLSAAIVPMFYMSAKKRFKYILFIVLLIGISTVLLMDFVTETSIPAIERWTYFYDTGGLNRLLYSGRDDFWEIQKQTFFDSDLSIQFWGMGIVGKSVERDHLDSLLMFGYVGLTLITSFFLYLIIVAFRNRYNNTLARIVIFSDCLILGIGFMAGHIWYSAMASVYIALFNVLCLPSCKEALFLKER